MNEKINTNQNYRRFTHGGRLYSAYFNCAAKRWFFNIKWLREGA